MDADEFTTKCELQQRLRGHTHLINALSFSPDGVHLASGSDDGYIVVWTWSTGQVVAKWSTKQGPVVALKWLDYQVTAASFLVSAGADGTVNLWCKEAGNNRFSLVGMYTVYDTAIENMTSCQTLLAVVGTGRLTVFDINVKSSDPFKLLVVIPPRLSSPAPGLARTVHFFDSEGSSAIMVGFLDAKTISAWEIPSWKKLWSNRIATRIGNSAWSESSRTLLVWNLSDGIDIYHIVDTRLTWLGKLRMKIMKNVVVQMAFSPDARYAICGSDSGSVYIWDMKLRIPAKVLHHKSNESDSDLVQTVALACPQYYTYIIASASSDPNHSQPSICIWSSTKIKSNGAHAQLTLVTQEVDTTYSMPRAGNVTGSMCMFFLAVLTASVLSTYLTVQFNSLL